MLGALGKLAKYKLTQMPGGAVHRLTLNLGRKTCSHPHTAEPRRKNSLSQGLQGSQGAAVGLCPDPLYHCCPFWLLLPLNC